MKKIIGIISLCLLLLAAAFPVYAAESLTLSDCTAAPGDTVLLSVTLEETVNASSMHISYTYDPELLEPNTDWCSWGVSGSLKDFNSEDQGVWASQKQVQVQGEICTLAFYIKQDAAFVQTPVECTLTVKDDAGQVQKFQAQGLVKSSCRHDFGQGWVRSDDLLHQRQCSICGGKQTAEHDWDAGVLADGDTGGQVKVYTCSACGATKSTAAFAPQIGTDAGTADTDPAAPVTPTAPQSGRHTHEHQPTAPGQNGSQENPEPTRNYESTMVPEWPDVPQATQAQVHSEQIPAHTHAAQETSGEASDHQDHTGHDHETAAEDAAADPASVIAVMATVAVLGGAAWWYLRKKRK